MELLFLQEEDQSSISKEDLNSPFFFEEVFDEADELYLESIEEYHKLILECSLDEFKLFKEEQESRILNEEGGILEFFKKLIAGAINFIINAVKFLGYVITTAITSILGAVGGIVRKVFNEEASIFNEEKKKTVKVKSVLKDYAGRGIKWQWVSNVWYSAYDEWEQTFNKIDDDTVGDDDRKFFNINHMKQVSEKMDYDKAKEAINRLNDEYDYYYECKENINKCDNYIEMSESEFNSLLSRFSNDMKVDKRAYTTCKNFLEKHLKILKELKTRIEQGEKPPTSVAKYSIQLDKAAIRLVKMIFSFRVKTFNLFRFAK